MYYVMLCIVMYYVMLCIVVCCSDLIDISAQAHSADVTEENEAQHRSKQYMYVKFIIYLSHPSQSCDLLTTLHYILLHLRTFKISLNRIFTIYCLIVLLIEHLFY